MTRFSERREAIRAAAQSVCPPDCFVVLSDNLSHLGNGTFAVSIKRERTEPVSDDEYEGPDANGEGGTDLMNETVADCRVRWDDDVDDVPSRLAERWEPSDIGRRAIERLRRTAVDGR